MLALVGEAYGGGGGIAQYNRDFLGAVARLGQYRIEVLPRHGRSEAALPANVEQAAPLAARAPYALRALGMAKRADVIFCGHLFMAPLAALLAKLTGAKLLIQLHGIEGWSAPGWLTRRAVAAADLVLCVSRDTRAKLLAWSTLPPERAVVASNTVGPAFAPGDRAAARTRWGLGDKAVILSVGRLDQRERYKGQDRVIAALPGLKAAGLDPLYLVAGDGDDLPRLQALARTAGVEGDVRFLGQVGMDDLPDLYRAADLFALPSTGEGFGIVFLEAMACGTNAVGLAAGGAVDALRHGGTAVSEDELPQALRELLARPATPDLPREVEQRFGSAAFCARIDALMGRLAI